MSAPIVIAERELYRAHVERPDRIIEDARMIMLGSARRGIYVQTTERFTRMRRFYLTPRGSNPQVFLHEILGDDEGPHHDHPWNFRSIILRGGYAEELPSGSYESFSAGDIVERPAAHAHRIRPTAYPTITLVIASPVIRAWGAVSPQ